MKWWNNASIYQIIVDRFNGGWKNPPQSINDYVGGTLNGIKDKLDYIRDLGYDAILLTPIFKSAAYHGYHTVSYEEIDPHFGTWDDLFDLVKAVHDKGMKIICDFVPNHCHIKHPFFVEARNNVNSKKRQWFSFTDTGCGYKTFLHYKELPKWNLYNDAAADYMIGVAEKLLYNKVDGIRLDHVIGLPFIFLKDLSMRTKAKNPDFFIFGEATATDIKDFSTIEFKTDLLRSKAKAKVLNREELQSQYIDVIDGVLDFQYRDIILEEIKKGHRIMNNPKLINKLKEHFFRYPDTFSLLLFLDNPDTERIMFFIDKYAGGDKTLLDEVVTFTKNLPYPSVIYYGTEQYMTHAEKVIGGKPYADLQVRKPMDWNK